MTIHRVSHPEYLVPQFHGLFPLLSKLVLSLAQDQDSLGDFSNGETEVFVVLLVLVVEVRFHVTFELLNHNSHEIN